MISILLPTRHRRDNIARLHQSIVDTAEHPEDIELIIAVDDDDASYEGLGFKSAPAVTWLNTQRKVLSEYWNECYGLAQGDILMHCGDDIVFQTKGWDTVVKDTFDLYDDKIVFVFGNDGSGPTAHDGRFGTHGFIHRKWVETQRSRGIWNAARFPTKKRTYKPS
jgi:glycosyltransferase involved in cell wall biosynthesis